MRFKIKAIMTTIKPFIFTLFLVLINSLSIFGQEKTLFTIDKKPVSVSEFEYIYKKNNINNKADYSKASLQEYLDLFVNFKLKVKEAQESGADKDPVLMDELQSYENQLFESYLDKKIMDKLTEEAYKRSLQDVSISHIFISFDPNSPKSISEAKTNIDNVYSLLQGGSSFEELAKVYSMDKNSRDNGGLLGYFTALQIAYKPLEDIAYTIKKGTYSTPTMTEAGFHIVKVNDIRPANGRIKVAIIKRLISPFDSLQTKTKNQIDSIYAELKKGADFGDMARRLSEDNYTNFNGGELDWFGIGQYNETFENEAFALQKDLDMSLPFKTKTAWYIIKRLEKAKIATLDEVKPILETKIRKSSRYETAKNTFADSLFKNWNLKIDQLAFESLKSKTLNGFEKNENNYVMVDQPKSIIFGFNGYKIDENQLGHAIEDNLGYSKGLAGESRFNAIYTRAFTGQMLDLYRTYLINTNSDYGNLVKEYKEGILLFDQMEKNVWSKAMEDTTGLKNFFEKNRDKFKYNERAAVSAYSFKNAKKAKAFSKLALKNKNLSDSLALNILNSLGLKENTDFTVEQISVEKNNNALSSIILWVPGNTKSIPTKDEFIVYKTNSISPARPKELEEVKGFVVAAYQEEIEKNWIKTLKLKYPVVINQGVLDELIKK